MKKTIIFSIMLMLCLIIKAKGQGFEPTTQEEYNYVIRGYDVERTSGLDPKKGYTMKDIISHTEKMGNIKIFVQVKSLIRQRNNKICAFYLHLNGRVFCLSSNIEHKKKHYQDIYDYINDSKYSKQYREALSYTYGKVFEHLFISELFSK